MSNFGFSDQPALLTVRHSRRQDNFLQVGGALTVLLGSAHLAAVLLVDGYRDGFDVRVWSLTILLGLTIPPSAYALSRGRQPVIARLTAHGVERYRARTVPWSDCTAVSHGKQPRSQVPFVRIHRRGRQPIRLHGLFEDGTPEDLGHRIAALTGLPNLGYRLLDFAPGSLPKAEGEA